MKMNFRLVSLSALAVLGGSAYATDVYAIDNLGATNGGTVGDRLIRFDSTDPAGTAVVVGDSGIASTLIGGLAFNGAGTLFAAAQATNNIGMIYSVNTSTGAFTQIGNSGLTNGIQDLAWDPSNNRMLALSQGSGIDATIHSINLTTGTATLVSTLTGTGANRLFVGLTVDSSGNVFAHDLISDFMTTVNLGAGTVADMSAGIGVNTNFSQGMGTDWSRGDEWMLGAIGNSPSFFSQPMLINPVTGAGTPVGADFGLNAGTGLPEYELGDLDYAPVPEPASIAALGLGALALIRRRKAKKA